MNKLSYMRYPELESGQIIDLVFPNGKLGCRWHTGKNRNDPGIWSDPLNRQL